MKFKNSDFVHAHCHSEFSQFDGLSQLKKLVLKAREMEFPALAITDHGTIGSWIKFIKECSATKDKNGDDIPYKPIKPILGCEVYLSRKMEYKSKDDQPDGQKGNRHLNIWAKNYKGYENLCTLSEKSWVDGFYFTPRIDLELLEKHSEGLIIGSACLSSAINANLLYDRYDSAKDICGILKDIFGEDFFLEAMYHGIDKEALILPEIFKLGKEMDIPVIATNDCHYLLKEHAKSHEVLMCMSTSNCITNPKHLKHPYEEFYLKSAEEMAKIFRFSPECLRNTVALSDRIDTEDITKNLFGGMRLPNIEIPKEYADMGEFEGSYEYMKKKAMDGMKKRGWDKSPDHVATLKKELKDVRVAWENNGYDFATYFLIEEDIMKFANDSDILTGPGRGCLSGDVGIVMGEGETKKIKDIKEGDNVISLSGKKQKVVKKHKYNIKDETLLNIKCYYGDSCGVTVTKDHKILVEKLVRPDGWEKYSDSCKKRMKRYKDPTGNHMCWINAKDLEVGDWVFVPYVKENFKQNNNKFIDFGEFQNNSDMVCDKHQVHSMRLNPMNKKNILSDLVHDRYISFDDDFFYVVGKFISDGWITRRDKSYIAFAFNSNEEDQIYKIINYFDKYNFSIYINKHVSKNLIQVYIKSKFIYALFKKMFKDYNFCASSKYIPELFIKENNYEKIKSLLIGLHDGDGSLSKYKLSYTTVSKKLANQIRYIYRKIGVPSSLSLYERIDKREAF